MRFVSSLRTIREPERELAFTLACANPGAVLADISLHVQTEGRGYEKRAASPTTVELRGPRTLAALARLLLRPEPVFVAEAEPDEHGDCEVTLRGRPYELLASVASRLSTSYPVIS
jgi:hypothetical protein